MVSVGGLPFEAKRFEKGAVVVHAWVRGGKELVAVENRICTREEAERLGLACETVAAGGEADFCFRQNNARCGDQAHQLENINRWRVGEWSSGDRGKAIDRHALRLRVHGAKNLEHFEAVDFRFPHANNSATANAEARALDRANGIQTILEGVGADDFFVMLGRGVDVVVVGGEAGFLELAGLDVTELAEGNTHFHAKLADLAHGLEHHFKLRVAVADALPCRTHAEAGRAIFPRRASHGQNLVHRHEALFFQACVVVRALGAITAILAATAGLYAKQRAKLDLVFRPELQKNPAAFLNEIEEGTVVDLFEAFQSGFHEGRFSFPAEASQSAVGETNPLEPRGRGTILAVLPNQTHYAIRTTRSTLRRHGA